MDDPASMQPAHRPGHCRQDSRGHRGVDGAVRQPLRQARAVDEFHREEVLAGVLAHIMDRHDMRVADPGRRLRLGIESSHLVGPRQVARQDHLDRNHAIQPLLPGAIDHAHPPATDLLQQDIVAEIGRAGIIADSLTAPGRIAGMGRPADGAAGRGEPRRLFQVGREGHAQAEAVRTIGLSRVRRERRRIGGPAGCVQPRRRVSTFPFRRTKRHRTNLDRTSRPPSRKCPL